MNSQTLTHAYSEFLGTFALVFVGSASIMMATASSSGSLIEVAAAHGLVLAVFVTMFKHIAAHFNPAVTIGFLFARRITPTLAGVHIAAQIAGATAAAFLLKLLVPAALFTNTRGGGQTVSTDVTGWQAWGLEAMITFFLMSAIYGTVVDKRSPNIGGFGVGLTVAFGILAVGPLTGGSFNPARSLGPAIANGVFEAQAIYWTAPVVGAVLAAVLYERLILSRAAEQNGAA